MRSRPALTISVKNSEGAGRQSTENITITTKEDKPGIDIHIKPGTKTRACISVIITEAGITETVYNDFYIGEGADVLIVAGCGIHNAGNEKSEHDGVHRFFSSGRTRTSSMWRSITARATAAASGC